METRIYHIQYTIYKNDKKIFMVKFWRRKKTNQKLWTGSQRKGGNHSPGHTEFCSAFPLHKAREGLRAWRPGCYLLTKAIGLTQNSPTVKAHHRN